MTPTDSFLGQLLEELPSAKSVEFTKIPEDDIKTFVAALESKYGKPGAGFSSSFEAPDVDGDRTDFVVKDFVVSDDEKEEREEAAAGETDLLVQEFRVRFRDSDLFEGYIQYSASSGNFAVSVFIENVRTCDADLVFRAFGRENLRKGLLILARGPQLATRLRAINMWEKT